MKAFKIFSLSLLLTLSAIISNAQELSTEVIPVSGNCGMCKSNIEKAAKLAGVSEASWDQDKKVVTIKYNPAATTAAKVQQGIASAGYDTRDVKATDASYKKLHACCQYDRTPVKESKTEASPAHTCTETTTSGKTKSCCAKTN